MKGNPASRRLTDVEIERIRPLLPPVRRPLTDDERARVDRWRLRLGWREPVDDAEVAELERWRHLVGREPDHGTTPEQL
jgi:hypothetical protein